LVQDKKLAIIVPCYNEINTIIETYNKIKIHGVPIIVDDCSDDGTREILISKKIKFIKNKVRSGYEKTIINGFHYINKNLPKVDFVATIDADLELPPKYLLKLYKSAKKHNYDIMIGSRKKLNRITENILSFFFRSLFDIDDPISGLKIYKKIKIKKILNKISNNFFLVDILIISLNKKYSIKSQKILTKKRKDLPRVGSSLRVNLKILKILIYSLYKKKYYD
jgi:glycosyltransferase involved in cell wall biosynthesis